MRRGAEFEGGEHGAEFCFYVFFVVSEDAEGFVHDFWVVVADGTGAYFVAVHDHVVLVGHDGQFVLCVFEGFETAFGHAKRVVAEVELFLAIVKLIKWEIDNPAKGDFVGVFEVEVVSERDAELA